MKQWLKRTIIRLRSGSRKVKFGKNSIIGTCSEFEGCNRIGDNTVFQGKLGYASYIGGNAKITGAVGKYCCIAPGVQVINGFHPVDAVSIHPAFFSVKKQCGTTYVEKDLFKETRYAEPGCPVVIGNDVWIGQNALLLAGIRIGDGAVIAAGAVVTQDVAPYTIIGGVPAKLIRRRFDTDTAEKLQKIAWWNWPEEQLRERTGDFSDPTAFVQHWYPSDSEQKYESL